MAHVTIVRHGQANTGARDEKSYDRLSDLGHQQARWLGEHFRETGETFARFYCGTLRRHQETAAGVWGDQGIELIQDPRLNEFQYYAMSTLIEEQHGIKTPVAREEFARHLPKVLALWQAGEIADVPESFQDFEKRTEDALHEIAAGHGRALVVSSGGWLGMAMRKTLNLDIRATAMMCLSIMNTSVHRWQPIADELSLVQFNAIPHLRDVKRQFAQTHL